MYICSTISLKQDSNVSYYINLRSKKHLFTWVLPTSTFTSIQNQSCSLLSDLNNLNLPFMFKKDIHPNLEDIRIVHVAKLNIWIFCQNVCPFSYDSNILLSVLYLKDMMWIDLFSDKINLYFYKYYMYSKSEV